VKHSIWLITAIVASGFVADAENSKNAAHKKESGPTPAVSTRGNTKGSDTSRSAVFFQPPAKTTQPSATNKKPSPPVTAVVAQPDAPFDEVGAESRFLRLEEALQAAKKENEEARKFIDQQKLAVAVGGQLFAFYSYTTNGIEGKDFNRFDLDRLYLTAKGWVFNEGKLQLTTDLYRNTAAGSYYTGLTMRLKFALFDYAPSSTLSIKLGMIPTVWPGFVDGVWKYRGIQPTVTDRNGYFASADLGLSVSYALPDKFGEVSGFILNGGGYTAPETNRFKDAALRVSLYPFPHDSFLKSLILAGYYYKGANASASSNALQRDRFGSLVGYSYSYASIGVEYSVRKDAPTNPDTVVSGNALSMFGEVKAPFEEWKDTFAFVWRYDVVEPNTHKGGDMTRFAIVGLAFKPHEKLTFVLDRQWVNAETASLIRNDGTKTDYDCRWFIHTIVNF
jgi:hypothetical protein